MVTKITFEDEFGSHEFESNSDCICIYDDGNGNVSIVEDFEDDDSLRCDSCTGFCISHDYCKYEGNPFEDDW